MDENVISTDFINSTAPALPRDNTDNGSGRTDRDRAGSDFAAILEEKGSPKQPSEKESSKTTTTVEEPARSDSEAETAVIDLDANQGNLRVDHKEGNLDPAGTFSALGLPKPEKSLLMTQNDPVWVGEISEIEGRTPVEIAGQDNRNISLSSLPSNAMPIDIVAPVDRVESLSIGMSGAVQTSDQNGARHSRTIPLYDLDMASDQAAMRGVRALQETTPNIESQSSNMETAKNPGILDTQNGPPRELSLANEKPESMSYSSNVSVGLESDENTLTQKYRFDQTVDTNPDKTLHSSFEGGDSALSRKLYRHKEHTKEGVRSPIQPMPPVEKINDNPGSLGTQSAQLNLPSQTQLFGPLDADRLEISMDRPQPYHPVANLTHANPPVAQIAQASHGYSVSTGSLQNTEIRFALTETPGGFEVAVHPESLGKLSLRLDSGHAGLTVTVMSERADTQDLARRHVELLEKELNDLGFENLRFEFNYRDDTQRSEEWLEAEERNSIEIIHDEKGGTGPTQRIALTGLDIRI